MFETIFTIATMNNDIILQSLTEAFEIIKDSWETKKEAIINCIVETERYDGSLAMDMWLYILQCHMPIVTQEDSNSFVDDVLDRFLRKHEETDTMSGEHECRAFLNHVAPHLIKKEELIISIFGNTYNAGYRCYPNLEWDEILTPRAAVCVSCILLLGNAHIVDLLIKSLAQNELMFEISMGHILLRANKYIEYICRNENEFGKKYAVSTEVKEALLKSLQYIKDKEERAECTIAFLSM